MGKFQCSILRKCLTISKCTIDSLENEHHSPGPNYYLLLDLIGKVSSYLTRGRYLTSPDRQVCSLDLDLHLGVGLAWEERAAKSSWGVSYLSNVLCPLNQSTIQKWSH